MKNKKSKMRYELPQMSETLGAYATFDTLSQAKSAAQEQGYDVIWRVTGELVPLFAGKIWVLVDGSWSLMPHDFCCPCCSGHNQALH
jgi:hypothetical protein